MLISPLTKKSKKLFLNYGLTKLENFEYSNSAQGSCSKTMKLHPFGCKSKTFKIKLVYGPACKINWGKVLPAPE
jgi:hypothetical protein